MTAEELEAGLPEVLARTEADAPQDQRWHETLETVSAHAAPMFQVSEREVAVLLVTDDGRSLRFVFPLELGAGPNDSPLEVPSVAGEGVRSGRGVADNAFVQTEHLGFYEGVRLEGPEAGAIQKLVAAPIRRAGPAFGVIAVSRKAKDAAAAGSDFTPQDPAAPTEIGAAVAPPLRQLKPKLV